MLLEYNPNLSEVPRAARMAYAKFMTPKIKQEYKTGQKDSPIPKSQSLDFPLKNFDQTNHSPTNKEKHTGKYTTFFKTILGILKVYTLSVKNQSK